MYLSQKYTNFNENEKRLKKKNLQNYLSIKLKETNLKERILQDHEVVKRELLEFFHFKYFCFAITNIKKIKKKQ